MLTVFPDVEQLDVTRLADYQEDPSTGSGQGWLVCRVCGAKAIKRLDVTVATRNPREFTYHPLENLNIGLCDDHAHPAVASYLELLEEPPHEDEG